MLRSALPRVALGSKLAWSVAVGAGVLAVAACGSRALVPHAALPGAGSVAHVVARSNAGWLTPEAKRGKHLVYLAGGNVVYVFDKHDLKQGPIGEITDGVGGGDGLAVDRRGNLYVANDSNNTVTRYPRGSTKPSLTYTNGISYPEGIVVDDKSGRLYVANFNSYAVTEYPKRSTNPDVTISFQALEGNDPLGMALDSAGNLFVSALGYPTARAYEVKAGSQTPTDLGISGILVMHGIAVDKKGDVIVVDQGGQSIDVFPPGSDTPFKKITDVNQPELIALDERERRLYVANAGYTGYDGELAVFSYPSGRLVNTVHLTGYGNPQGVAVSPL